MIKILLTTEDDSLRLVIDTPIVPVPGDYLDFMEDKVIYTIKVISRHIDTTATDKPLIILNVKVISISDPVK